MFAPLVQPAREARASAQEVRRSVEATAANPGCPAVVAPVSMSRPTLTTVVPAATSAHRVKYARMGFVIVLRVIGGQAN